MGSYVEWENFPDKKAKAHKILTSQTFPPNPEYQMGPIPDTNPVLDGMSWKMWHHAVGGALMDVPEKSWATVLKEKHPEMLHLLQFPYNGEPPKRLVTAKPITPNSLHFVRNHGGIPIIDEEKWSLDIDGLVNNPQTLTMKDIMDETRFPRIKKAITMQCSGTRRIEQIMAYPGQGDQLTQAPWAEGAIGTAEYVGISLKKVIKACGGLKDGAKHLEFYGADSYVKELELGNYVVSVPWSKVKANEVLLCWEMNGERLPAIHGFPLRVMVLGYIGARSVKWLYRIKAIEHPSLAPVQSKEYLYFNQQVGKVSLFTSARFDGQFVLTQRTAQSEVHRRHPDPGDASQLGDNVPLADADRDPQRLHPLQGLGLLRRRSLARTRRTLRRRRFQLVRGAPREHVGKAQVDMADVGDGSPVRGRGMD